MFLFEKSLIGAYCNRYMTKRKGRTPFHAKAELKQTSQAKILMSSILIRKRAHQIVEHAYHQGCGSGSGGSGPFSVKAEAEARKFYRFHFHRGYLT